MTPCVAWDDMNVPRNSPIPRHQWLASLNGVFNNAMVQDARNKAHQTFVDEVRSWQTMLPSFPFSCYNEAWLRTDISSQIYSDTALRASSMGAVWPPDPLDICSGPADCLDHRADTMQGNKDVVREYIDQFTSAIPCSSSCDCVTNMVDAVCSFAQDMVAQTMSSGQSSMPLFNMNGVVVAPDATRYDPLEKGCSLIMCCSGTAGCSQNRIAECRCYTNDVTPPELEYANIISVSPTIPAWIKFVNGSQPDFEELNNAQSYLVNGHTWSALDPCAVSGHVTRCSLADPVLPDDCSSLANVAAQVVCEANVFANQNSFANCLRPGGQEQLLCPLYRGCTNAAMCV